MKLAAGNMKTGILLVTLTAGSALAQIPNVIQHVQDKMSNVQQQNKAASDAALKGSATSTAKASAGKPAAATAAKTSALAQAAAKPASTPVVAKATSAPASQKTTAATTPKPATAKASAPATAKAAPAQPTIAKSAPLKSAPAQSAPVKTATAKASTPAVAKPAVVAPVAVKAATTAASKPVAPTKDPFAKAAAPKADAKASNAKPADTKADSKPSAKDAKDAKEEAPEPKKEGFITAGSRRDPFISPVVQHLAGSGCSTGKRCLEIDQIALRGIVKSEAGMIAVVVNSLDKAYFLRENDPVFNGYVLKISGDTVVFKETVQDKLGHLSTREIVKKITTPAV